MVDVYYFLLFFFEIVLKSNPYFFSLNCNLWVYLAILSAYVHIKSTCFSAY